MSTQANAIIERLGLVPLEFEGGYYRETYRSGDVLPDSALDGRYPTDKALSTAIYYLLTPDTFSAMHRLPSDEVFHFYSGDPVEMLQLRPDGTHGIVFIGADIEAGYEPQVVVPGGTWQGCRLMSGGDWALMGTTVAPAFDPDDYEPGDRGALIAAYPDCAELIRALTHASPSECSG